MTVDEMRAELERELLRRAKQSEARPKRWDVMMADPKAYFTRPADWDEAKAERFGWDLSQVPRLNVTMEGGATEDDKDEAKARLQAGERRRSQAAARAADVRRRAGGRGR